MSSTSETRKLYRAGKEYIIGGVCAGFAEYLAIDVTLLRIFWLIATLFHGFGAVVYLVCLVLIPKNPEHEKLPLSEQKKAENSGLFLGIALVLIGASFAFNNWFGFHFIWHHDWWHFWGFHWSIIWPILLIIFGVYYIYRFSNRNLVNVDEATKREQFYRSRSGKMIGGVCAGLAKYWNLDVTLVRVLYALLTLFTAIWLGVITYIVILITIQEEPMTEKTNG